MFSGLIFDVEGTLIDCVHHNLCSLQEGLKRFGYEVPFAKLQPYSGLDGDQMLRLVVPQADESERKRSSKRRALFTRKNISTAFSPSMVSATCSLR